MKNIKVDALPDGISETVRAYVNKVLEKQGDNILSVFIYGSAAGNDFDVRISDINMAFIVKDSSCGKLQNTAGIIKEGLNKKINVPLFMTPGYINMSLDTFPMEFLTMRESRIILCGEDPLAGINIDREDLRRECEHQIKGKILHVRQAYLLEASNGRFPGKMLWIILKSLFPIFETMLFLKNGGYTRTRKEVLHGINEAFDLDMRPFMQILEIERLSGVVNKKAVVLYIEDFLDRLERSAAIIDGMKI